MAIASGPGPCRSLQADTSRFPSGLRDEDRPRRRDDGPASGRQGRCRGRACFPREARTASRSRGGHSLRRHWRSSVRRRRRRRHADPALRARDRPAPGGEYRGSALFPRGDGRHGQGWSAPGAGRSGPACLRCAYSRYGRRKACHFSWWAVASSTMSSLAATSCRLMIRSLPDTPRRSATRQITWSSISLRLPSA